jgi:hypothetical protein
VYDEGSWVPVDKNNTLDKVIEKESDHLFTHFRAVREQDDSVKRNEDVIMRWFLEMKSKTGAGFYRVRRDLFAIILANSSVPIYLQVVDDVNDFNDVNDVKS